MKKWIIGIIAAIGIAGCTVSKINTQQVVTESVAKIETHNVSARNEITKAIPHTDATGTANLRSAVDHLVAQMTDITSLKTQLSNVWQQTADDAAKYSKLASKWYVIGGTWIESTAKWLIGSLIVALILRGLSLVLLGKYPTIAGWMATAANTVFGFLTVGISKLTSMADLHEHKAKLARGSK